MNRLAETNVTNDLGPHHAELVEALTLAAKRLSQAGVGGASRSTIKGWADEAFSDLAKIGGDA
jgi:hypothetical protein